MQYAESILDLMGNTPLLRLKKVTEGIPATILAKVEYFNPGGSVKDRIGLYMINAAEASGQLQPGGTIVEPTSGNTGMGLALVASQRDYRCIFVCPDKVSQDKIDALKAFGAEVVTCPTAVEPDDPRSYYSVSERLSKEIPGAFCPNQYHNQNNPLAHYETTGPEIWRQTEGRITHFVAGMGTGGTITGVGRYLKEQNPNVQIVGVDPEGSMYSDPNNVHPYLIEGIGEDMMPGALDLAIVDEIVQVHDQESFDMTRLLPSAEGLLVGISCGAAMVGALRYARQHQLGPDAVMVVLLPDSGRGYLSKAFNETWLRKNGLWQAA
ncbi:MAG: pyridoxal-phosphate dependent enzyme [Candidatus Sericytochromatia bacterium]|nr:pyridoxal-phosphate dependent enzyme [Candidatus Sericytochromatia bacterium]